MCTVLVQMHCVNEINKTNKKITAPGHMSVHSPLTTAALDNDQRFSKDDKYKIHMAKHELS